MAPNTAVSPWAELGAVSTKGAGAQGSRSMACTEPPVARRGKGRRVQMGSLVSVSSPSPCWAGRSGHHEYRVLSLRCFTLHLAHGRHFLSLQVVWTALSHEKTSTPSEPWLCLAVSPAPCAFAAFSFTQ